MFPLWGFPWLSFKGSACSAEEAGDAGSIPASGTFPRGGNGNPLQYSCLENSMDGGAWRVTVHRIAKNQTQLNNFTSLTRCMILLTYY